MKNFLLFIIVVVSIGLSSCARVDTSNPDQVVANRIVEEMVYAKDSRTGICYSVVISGGGSNSQTDAAISHSAVNCEDVPKALLYK